MWRLGIEQYFQVEDYALWDVIENRNSFKPYKDARTLFAAIQTRFVGHEATKKTQKTLLKSLPSEWNTHVVVWRNKPDLDTMSFDDLYNNFKIIEQESVSTVTSWDTLLGSAEDLGIKITGADQTHKRTINVEEISSKAMLAIDGAGFDWSFMADEEVPTDMALMAFSDSEVHNDKTCSKTCLKSFETLKTQLDDLRIEFNKSEFNLATYKRGLASVEEQLVLLVFYKKNEVLFWEQLAVLKRDISYKDSKISVLKSELDKLKQDKESNQLKIEKFDNASKSLDKLIGSQIPDKSRKGLGFMSYNALPPPPTGLFSPPTIDLSNSGLKEFQQPEFEGVGLKISNSVSEDIYNEVMKSLDALLVEELANCNYHQKEMMVFGNNYTRVNYNYAAQKAHPSTQRNMAPRAVLMKTILRPLNTARPVNTAHPKTTVYSARPMPKAVNTARPNKAVVNAVKENQVNAIKASTCWVWRPTKLNSHLQIEDQGYVDSGCSRHMTGNISYLSDFKAFDGRYVTFGGGAKGGRITGKGTLKTGKATPKPLKKVLVQGHFNKETRSSKTDIVMPLWERWIHYFDSSSKNAVTLNQQPSSDIEKKDDERLSFLLSPGRTQKDAKALSEFKLGRSIARRASTIIRYNSISHQEQGQDWLLRDILKKKHRLMMKFCPVARIEMSSMGELTFFLVPRSQSRNRQQQQAPPTFVEPFDLEEPIDPPDPPVVTMADNRTMVQLLQAPTEGYEEFHRCSASRDQDRGKL
ncbi:hypothetical protein Tco_0615779 [Tanacetum coccineum]